MYAHNTYTVFFVLVLTVGLSSAFDFDECRHFDSCSSCSSQTANSCVWCPDNGVNSTCKTEELCAVFPPKSCSGPADTTDTKNSNNVASNPLTTTATAGSSKSTDADYVNSLEVIPDQLTLRWKTPTPSSDKISFMITCHCTGWFSVGWSPRGEMGGADAVIAYVDQNTGKTEVRTYLLDDDTMPKEGSNNKLILEDISGEFSNGIAKARFTRSSAGFVPLNSPHYVIGAFHPDTLKLQYHGPHHSQDLIRTNYSSLAGTVTESAPFSVFDLHGVLMFTGWTILLFGTLAARYFRWTQGGLWFTIHQILQYFGFTITIVSFILVFAYTRVHFNTLYHAQLGTVITALSVIQVVGAIFRPHPPHDKDEPKSNARKWFEVLHWWNGRIMLLLVGVQIYSGITLHKASPIILVGYGIFTVLIVLSVVIAEIVSHFKPQMKVVPCFGHCCSAPAEKVDVQRL